LQTTTSPINLHGGFNIAPITHTANGTAGESEAITTATSTSGGKGTVFLQAARAVASNEGGTKSWQVRILFDNGSQRSYVTSNVKSR